MTGTALCWGNNNYGQLFGVSPSFQSQLTPPNTDNSTCQCDTCCTYLSISTGLYHSCYVGVDNTAFCIGDNSQSQLTVPSGRGDALMPMQIPYSLARPAVLSVAAGDYSTCLLTPSNSVQCWGKIVPDVFETDVPGVTNATAVAAGGCHACAILQGGTATCWGCNKSGQVGSGTTIDEEQGTSIATDVQAIALGTSHTCALTKSGGVRCWGDDSNGQLGDGIVVKRTIPSPVIGTCPSP